MKTASPVENKKKVLIKIGGTFLSDSTLLDILLEEIKHLSNTYSFVLVHGGGKTLSAYSKEHNTHAEFDTEGRRITSDIEMLYSDRILSGEINTKLVRTCTKNQLKAVGISGADANLIIGTPLNSSTYSGTVNACNITLVTTLITQGYVPVISSVASTKQGSPLNINADEVAQSIAETWNANYLLLLSDIPGIIIQNTVISSLTEKEIKDYYANNTITNGMIIKTQNALSAIRNGVKNVIIGTISSPGDLLQLLEKKHGTSINKK